MITIKMFLNKLKWNNNEEKKPADEQLILTINHFMCMLCTYIIN